MASSTDGNDPDLTVQEVQNATSTDDSSLGHSEKTGDTEFFDVAEGSPKSLLDTGLPEVAEASEADIETTSIESKEEPSLQNNQPEGEAKDDVDATATEGSKDDQSDTESRESDSTEEQDLESSSSDSEGSDQSEQDTTKEDTEIEDTARSRDDVGTHQEPLGNKKDETKKVSNLENKEISGDPLFDKSSESNASALEPVSTTLPIDSLHADIDSMREVPISIENLEEVVSPLNEPIDGEEITPPKDNTTDLSELEIPTVQDDLLEENEIDKENSSKSSKSTNESQDSSNDEEGEKEEEEKEKVGSKYEGTIEEDQKSIVSDDVPESALIEAEKPSGNNDSPELEDLKASLQSNLSSLDPPATSPTKDNEEQELKHLKDILRGSAPSGVKSTMASDHSPSKNDDLESESGQNIELERLEDLMRGFVTDENESVSNGANEAENDPDKSSSLQRSDPQFSFPEKTVSAVNTTTNSLHPAPNSVPPNQLHDDPIQTKDHEFDVPKIIQAKEETKSSTPDAHLNDEGSTEEGLSVFSNATSGQDFLRSVSNAKKSLDEIDKEMRELKGVSAPRANKVEAKTDSDHINDEGQKAPIQKNLGHENVHAEVRKEKESTKTSQRRMEPPTQKEQGDSKHSSNEKKKKQRRKTAKKKQVHPEEEKPNGPIDPDGKVIPRTRYRKRGTERDTQSFSEVGNVEEKPYQKDPPMVIEGHLEPEEPPVDKNDTEKADSVMEKTKKTKKRKKKKKEVRRGDVHPKTTDRSFEDEDAELNMNSVVSSRMDRGDDGWSVPVDEINVDDEESDTYKSDDPHSKYDPWKEVPCSWCCRYLPHTLVVATTQAYRLDRADEKENELMIDSRH